MDTLINQIDHILIQQKYTKEIFVTMSEILDLPIAWDIKSYGGLFVSGGICFGNINIEILNYARFLRILGVAPNKDGIIGIAFESCISFKNGPVINLVKSKKDSILSILVKVKSIERAKEMLSKKQQITLNDNNEIIIEHKKECNLGLKLCE